MESPTSTTSTPKALGLHPYHCTVPRGHPTSPCAPLPEHGVIQAPEVLPESKIGPPRGAAGRVLVEQGQQERHPPRLALQSVLSYARSDDREEKAD